MRAPRERELAGRYEPMKIPLATSGEVSLAGCEISRSAVV
jgi:hypothetical protein